MNIKTTVAAVVLALGALSLTACGSSAPAETSEPPAVTQTQEATTPAEPATTPEDAVAVKAVELFRITVPDDPSTDEVIVEEMKAKGVEIVAFMDAGGTGTEFLNQEAAKDPANVVRNQALLTGAIALDPSIALHPNYEG